MSIEGSSSNKPSAKSEVLNMSKRELFSFAAGAFAAGILSGGGHAQESEAVQFEKELNDTFKRLLEGRNSFERRKERDADGSLVKWEVVIPQAEGSVEFGFYKKTYADVGQRIYLIFFDENGIPETGHDIVEYKDTDTGRRWVVDAKLVERLFAVDS